MLPVLVLSVAGIAQSESFGVKEIEENLYVVQEKNSITPVDQQQILALVKKAYGQQETEGNVRLTMMGAGDIGTVIVLDQNATGLLVSTRTAGQYGSVQLTSPEALAIKNILVKYVR